MARLGPSAATPSCSSPRSCSPLPFIVGRDPPAGRRSAASGSSSAGARRRFGDGPLAVVFFYADQPRDPVRAGDRRRRPSRATCRTAGSWSAWMVALFLVPNVVVVSAVEFDMNKYFQIMWIAVAILAAWLIRALGRRSPIVVVLAVSAISPALIAYWHLTNSARRAERRRRSGPRSWIAANTPRARRSSSPTPSSTARSTSPGGCGSRPSGRTSSNLGYDPAPREADTTAIYCDGPDVAAERMADLRRDLRALERRHRATCADGDRPTSPRATAFETVYDADGSRSGAGGRDGGAGRVSPWARRRS